MVEGTRCYEQLRILVDMKDFELYAPSSRCYEQLRVMDGMNNLGSRDLRSLDAMDNSRLRMI